MKGPRAQMSFFDRTRPTNPMVSTVQRRSALSFERRLHQPTSASNDKWYEVPCSLFDELEKVEDGRKSKEYDKDDGCNLRWIIPVQDIGIRIVKSRARLVFGHVDWCWSTQFQVRVPEGEQT